MKMHYYDTDFSESSVVTSTDTASNWSKPVKKKPKRRNTISAFPRRQARTLKTKKLTSKKVMKHNHFIMRGPRLRLHRYRLKIRRTPNLNLKQTRALIEAINDQSRVVYHLWPRCQQQTMELEAEIAQLQQRLRQLQVEEVEIKRKRWCRNCQREATYMHAKRFYCSGYCEEKFGLMRNQQYKMSIN